MNATRPLTDKLGRVTSTTGAQCAMDTAEVNPYALLQRHISGDWGNVSDANWDSNNAATLNGSRILSSYTLDTGVEIWIITDAERAPGQRYATTFLLPSEY